MKDRVMDGLYRLFIGTFIGSAIVLAVKIFWLATRPV